MQEEEKTFKGIYGKTVKGEKPENYMKKWKIEENEKLFELWTSGTDIEKISKDMGRTSGSITTQIYRLASKELDEDNIDEVVDKYKVQKEKLIYENNKKPRKEKNIDKEDVIIGLLRDIKELLLNKH